MTSSWRIVSTEVVTTERRRSRFKRASAVAFACSFAILGLGAWAGSWFGEFLLQLAGLGIGLSGLGYLGARVFPAQRELRQGGLLVVEPDRIVIERPRVKRGIWRSRILQGYLIEPNTLGLVLVEGEELRFDLESRADAEAALAELGLEATARPLSVPIVSPADEGSPGGRVFGLLALLGLAPLALAAGAASLVGVMRLLAGAGRAFPFDSLAFFFVSTVLTYLLFRYFSPRAATIGVDGITIDQPLGKRFVPFAQLAAIDEDDKGVVLTTRDGERVPLSVSFGKIAPFAADGSTERRAAIVDRIRQARARSGDGKLDEAKLARLDRAGRSISQWSQSLAQAKTAGYRVESFEADELVRVACDPEASPERRVGATLALRERESPEIARVRVAAGACVDEDLRHALEAAAEGEVAEAEIERVTARSRL